MKEWMIGLLFPRRCPVCDQIVIPKGELICPECRKQLSYVSGPVCMRCGKELLEPDGEYCMGCKKHRRTFEKGAALLNYNEVSAHSMVQIKYKNKREYLDFYGAAMVNRFQKVVRHWQADVLIPVPIHPSRRRKRGFNQAEELAKRLSLGWGIPVEKRFLIRSKRTAPQRDLDPTERLKNLEKAFCIYPGYEKNRKAPRCVILVDDIYTTGSTMEACSRVLKAAGVEKIYFVVICIGHGR